MITKRKIVLGFFANNRGLVLAAFLSALLANLLNVLLPLSIGKFYELALDDRGSVKGKIFEMLHLDIPNVHRFFIFFAAIILLKGIMTFFEKFLSGLTSERIAHTLRELSFASQLSHSMQSHLSKTIGKYLLRYSGDLRAIQNFVTRGVIGFTGDIFFMIMALVVLWLIQPKLTLILVGVLGTSAIVITALGKILQTASNERRNQRSKMLDFINSRLQAFYTIKSFNRETLELKNLRKRTGRLYAASLAYHRYDALIRSLLPVFFYGTLALVLVIATQDTQQAGSTGGQIFVFVLLFLYMQTVIKRLLRINLVWREGRVSLDKLIALIEMPSEQRPETSVIKELKGHLVFRDVTFAYEPGKPALNHVTFEILPDSITLIKGKQGSGKSTLFKLIQKIYDPQQGEIYLDKYNYKDLSPFEIRKEVTLVSTESPLLGSTVFKAISYKDELDKREDALSILNQLNISLADSEDGTLNAKLEEHAKNLSAGQRILLQFARAFLTRKKIILLDAPFQYLDEEAKQPVIEKLNKLKNRRTILLISDSVPEQLKVDQIIQL